MPLTMRVAGERVLRYLLLMEHFQTCGGIVSEVQRPRDSSSEGRAEGSPRRPPGRDPSLLCDNRVTTRTLISPAKTKRP